MARAGCAGSIIVVTFIGADPARVWAALRDIGSHVKWMDDALAIRFASEQRAGIGTRFECDTRVGPLRTLDRMEVVAWREGQAMAIRHVGLVTGEGRFTIEPSGSGTRLHWEERLAFPWWLGGRVGSALARPVLRAIWRRDLTNLKALVEGAPVPPAQPPNPLAD